MKDMPDDQKQMMQDAMNILLNGGAGMEAQAAQMKKTMELSQTRDRLRKQLEEKQKKKAEKEKTKVETQPVQKELSESQKEKLIADLERDFMREEKKQQANKKKKK
jgi:cell shape-determining protein MreC